MYFNIYLKSSFQNLVREHHTSHIHNYNSSFWYSSIPVYNFYYQNAGIFVGAMPLFLTRVSSFIRLLGSLQCLATSLAWHSNILLTPKFLQTYHSPRWNDKEIQQESGHGICRHISQEGKKSYSLGNFFWVAGKRKKEVCCSQSPLSGQKSCPTMGDNQTFSHCRSALKPKWTRHTWRERCRVPLSGGDRPWWK